MPSKSTRAFRTISEAGDELDLQPHVLRFWESKFPQIQPMKRSGGRRFYRPEDIEFLRGIKILLHREKHPIKDVQKLIRVRGAHSVIELGRSRAQAAIPKAIKDTVLVPDRIKPVTQKPVAASPVKAPAKQLSSDDEVLRRPGIKPINVPLKTETATEKAGLAEPTARVKPQVLEQKGLDGEERKNLESALDKLRALKSRWEEFK
ncbi:MAG: MerR family transcriptional regulator [Robiginitomaculum sp.]|nr:MAG: MerR family transcriptional regulator [Robiginitomaculum sp.]